MSDFKIAVLISGGGTTLRNLLEFRASDCLAANIVQVVSSNPQAAGNQYATDNSIPLAIVQRKDFSDDTDFSKAVFEHCRAQEVDLVVMGGFLKRLEIPAEFENRVINIHPSLIPAFSGKGYYGSRVHQAVVDYGCKISGCTVHFVDNQYDHGPIIAQRSLEVTAADSAESLAKKIFELECQLYPEIINLVAGGHISITGRSVTSDRPQ